MVVDEAIFHRGRRKLFYINALTKSNCSTLWIRSVWKWYPTDTEASRIIEESPFLCFMELSEISLTASSMRGISAGEEKSCAGLKESRFTVWIVLRGVALLLHSFGCPLIAVRKQSCGVRCSHLR